MAMYALALDAVAGQPEYTGQIFRGALSALLGTPPTGRPVGATSGVRHGTPTTTVSVSGSTVTIAPHSGVLDVEAAAEAGPYLYVNPDTETVTLDAAHATYTRWDRISVQLSDPSQGDGTSAPGVAIVYTAGTPSASPAMPAAPDRSLTLARIVVPQSGGGAASVVWLAPESVDGPPWYPDTQTRDVAIPAPPTGMIAVIGSGASTAVTVWDGTGWQPDLGLGRWQAYTPVIAGAGLTLGNGTVVGRYSRVGNRVTDDALVTLGSTSTLTGNFTVSLPSAPAGTALAFTPAEAFGRLTASGAYFRLAAFISGSAISVGAQGTNGQYSNPTVAGTWGTGGWIRLQAVYEA